MDNRIYLKRSITFLLVGIALLFGISYVIDFGVRHSNDAQVGKINALVQGSIDPAIAIFGSSMSEVGVDPAALQKNTGLSVYNFSLDGTRYMQYRGLIDAFSDHTQANKYVIFAESYYTFEKISKVNNIERYIANINNNSVFASLYELQPGLAWKCRYVPFYKYIAATNVYYKNAAIGLKNAVEGRSLTDKSLGYTPVDRHWEADQDEYLRHLHPFEIEVDPVILRNYVQTINRLKTKGRQVILVLTPVYTELSTKIADYAPLRRAMAQVAAETGSKYWDFSTINISGDKSYFYNAYHLNREGSAIFSNMLADSMKKYVMASQQ